MCGDNDRSGAFSDHSLPPSESASADYTAGISTERASPDFLCGFVDVGHHKKEEIPGPKGIAFPGSLDRKPPPSPVDVRGLGMFARRVQPFAPPPLLRFIQAVPVVIATQIMDVLAIMPLETGELADNRLAFGVFRGAYSAGHISEIKRDVPGKAGWRF